MKSKDFQHTIGIVLIVFGGIVALAGLGGVGASFVVGAVVLDVQQRMKSIAAGLPVPFAAVTSSCKESPANQVTLMKLEVAEIQHEVLGSILESDLKYSGNLDERQNVCSGLSDSHFDSGVNSQPTAGVFLVTRSRYEYQVDRPPTCGASIRFSARFRKCSLSFSGLRRRTG